MTVALAGNHRLRVAPKAMFDFLSQLPSNSKVLLRSGNSTRPGWFERLCAKACAHLWLDMEWVRPDPKGQTKSGDPGGVTWERDQRMVEQCDVVLAFFATPTPDETSGTWHVVERALARDTPCYAYGWDGKKFLRVGEWDPMDTWSKAVPEGG